MLRRARLAVVWSDSKCFARSIGRVAHCAALSTPILGDGKYGGSAAQLAGGAAAHRLHLHARSLEIPHPAGGTLRVTAPLPRHMRRMWEFFGFTADAGDPFAELELPA